MKMHISHEETLICKCVFGTFIKTKIKTYQNSILSESMSDKTHGFLRRENFIRWPEEGTICDHPPYLLLMAEILHHLGCIKPCKSWYKQPINWCRISTINSSFNLHFTMFGPAFLTSLDVVFQIWRISLFTKMEFISTCWVNLVLSWSSAEG